MAEGGDGEPIITSDGVGQKLFEGCPVSTRLALPLPRSRPLSQVAAENTILGGTGEGKHACTNDSPRLAVLFFLYIISFIPPRVPPPYPTSNLRSSMPVVKVSLRISAKLRMSFSILTLTLQRSAKFRVGYSIEV